MHQTLDRRTFLRASGVSLALPLLEAMSPTLARGAGAPPPKRLVIVCTTLGLVPTSFWPQTPGADYETTEYLELLKAYRKDFTLFSGLEHSGQGGRQPHNSEMTWLTAARGPGLDGFRNTVSLDQVVAEKLGYVTRFPSITLGSHLSLSQSYTSRGVMVPAETSPANLFAQLFLQGNPQEVARQKQKLQDGRSILDQLLSQRESLRRISSTADKQHLDEYFDSIRKAERDIAEAQGWLSKPKPPVTEKPPVDIRDHADIAGRVQLLMNLIPLIVQTDSSRVVTVMIQDHQAVPKIAGVSHEHHNLSHHGQDPARIAELKKIETELLRSFGSLLGQLRGKVESGGSLLDTTSVLFGSNLGNANSHETRNLPILLAGGGYKHGKFIAHERARETPLSNLFLSLLHGMGVEANGFGQSTGTLSW